MVKTKAPEASAGPGRLNRINMSQAAAGIFVGGVVLYLFIPVAVILLFSFTTSPRLSLPIEGVTLKWYQQAFTNPLFTDALLNSLLLAAITALVAGVIGTAFSFGLVQLRRRTRSVFLTVGLMPAVIPALVLGIALALWFRELGLMQGFGNACIGHILVGLPFVILTMNARLETFDFTILDAARDLGASSWRTFRDITFPLIRPTVLGAALLAMALSLDEFVVTWFNIGNSQTLPVLIWGLLRRGIDPSINALASVVLLCLVILVLLANRLTRKMQ
jgi:spermidine/putrescine transport system permease protein